MSSTSQLLAYYKLHPLIVTEDNKRLGDLNPATQLNAFKTWDPWSGPPVPNRWDTSLPAAVESKRFPGQYFNVRWAGGARYAEAERAEPYQKDLADFIVLLSLERLAVNGRVQQTNRILRGLHCTTGNSPNSNRNARADGEHVTWSNGSANNGRVYHGYIIFPRGVPLGSSTAAREARWRNRHVTTADVAYTPGALDDPILSEPLGREINGWFTNIFNQPIPDGQAPVCWIMVYDPATRIVQLYREDADPASAPEHTFNTPCRLPWEKLGLPPPPAQGGP